MTLLFSVFMFWLFKSLLNLGTRKRTWMTIFQWRRGSIKRRLKKWKLRNRRKCWQGEKMSHRRKCKYCMCKTRREIAIYRVLKQLTFLALSLKQVMLLVKTQCVYFVNERTHYLFFMTHLLEFADNFFCVAMLEFFFSSSHFSATSKFPYLQALQELVINLPLIINSCSNWSWKTWGKPCRNDIFRWETVEK